MQGINPRRLKGKLGAVAAVVLIAMLSGCAGVNPQPQRMALIAPSSALQVGATAHFQVPGYDDTAVQQWTVNNIAGGDAAVGTIDSNGMYQAPAVPPQPNNVQVSAVGASFVASGTISIFNPAPRAAAVSPDAAMQAATAPQVTVTGANFAHESIVVADGIGCTTKFVSAGRLTAVLPPNVLASAGTNHQIAVWTPAPGGGTSPAIPFAVVETGTVTASAHPLVALYRMKLPSPGAVTVEFGPDAHYGKSTSTVAAAPDGSVEVQVAGMPAASQFHMRAQVALANGTKLVDHDHLFTTGAVPPQRVPLLTVTKFAGMTPSPGIELLNLIFAGPGSAAIHSSAIDTDGRLIWYYDAEPGTTVIPLKLLPNGHFLVYINYNDHVNDSLREIDLAGNTIRDLKRVDLNQKLAARGFALQVDQFHHDVTPLPNGHFILLCQVIKQLTGLTGYSGPTTVWGDALVDLDPDLNPVWTWSTYDHLDPNRHRFGLPDWTHSNAVLYTANDGNLLLSMRHQDWVIKIDYENGAGSGAIQWRLGNQGDFTLTSGEASAWAYAQHYPRVMSIDGAKLRLAVMDNGNGRIIDAAGTRCGTTGAPACYSRMAIFDLDETSRTVTPVWDYRPGFYSFWGGSTEILGNGDVEGAFSAFGTSGSRIIEVTPGANSQPVWRLDVAGQNAYRGFRIPSLYPGVQWQ